MIFLIDILIIQSITFSKTVTNIHQFLRVRGGLFKLSAQQSKIKTYSVYSNLILENAAYSHIREAKAID